MTIVSGADPDIVKRLLGQPVVHFFAVNFDKLSPFGAAGGLSSRPRLLLRVDFQDAKSNIFNVLVAIDNIWLCWDGFAHFNQERICCFGNGFEVGNFNKSIF